MSCYSVTGSQPLMPTIGKSSIPILLRNMNIEDRLPV